MKAETKIQAQVRVKQLKTELATVASSASVTAYAIARDTGMTERSAYTVLNDDLPSGIETLIVAGRSVGLELVWQPVNHPSSNEAQ